MLIYLVCWCAISSAAFINIYQCCHSDISWEEVRREGEERGACQRELTGRRQTLGPQTSLDGRKLGAALRDGGYPPGHLTHSQSAGVLKQDPELKVSGEDESESPIVSRVHSDLLSQWLILTCCSKGSVFNA